MKLFALTLALAAGMGLAIDIEFPGFAHFKNWEGSMGSNAVHYHLPESGGGISVGVTKDICAEDVGCTGFINNPTSGWNPGIGNFKNADGTTNTTFDMYLGIKGVNGTAPAAFCTAEAGGSNHPDTQWLKCASDFCYSCSSMHSDFILQTYKIPPFEIYTACLKNSKCVGFRLRNDQSGGDLIQAVELNIGYFKLL
jgi:hypothetical protein